MSATRIAGVYVCLLTALAAWAPAQALEPGDHAFTLMHGGRERSYLLHLPPQARAGRPLPAVLNFHGGGGNAKAHRDYVRMDALADREGFLVVYPNGSGGLRDTLLTWNAGSCCGFAALGHVDDVGFAGALLDDLARRTPLDVARVYATGLSNGAMMAYRLAAQLPERIAAVAPVAGAMVTREIYRGRAVPVMHIHSSDDPRALYDGGLGPPFPMTRTRVLHPPVEEGIARWVRSDACAAKPRLDPPIKDGKGHAATRIAYAPCRDGAEVVLWKLSGAGHVWPGGKPDYLPLLLGASTGVIDANAEMWRFFSRFSLPR
jgi:polyhydroxybutyrate depolymerase